MVFRPWDTEFGRSFSCLFIYLFISCHITPILNQYIFFFFQQKGRRKAEFPCYMQISSLLAVNIHISQTKFGQPSFKGLCQFTACPFSCHFQWLLVPFLLLYLTFILWLAFVPINGKCTPFCSGLSVDYNRVLFTWLSCSIIAISVFSPKAWLSLIHFKQTSE